MLWCKHDCCVATILLIHVSCVLGYSDVPSGEGKGYDIDCADGAADSAPVHTEGTMNGIDHPDLEYLVLDHQCELATDEDVSKEQPMSKESLRESLKKQLEFCFSRWVL